MLGHRFFFLKCDFKHFWLQHVKINDILESWEKKMDETGMLGKQYIVFGNLILFWPELGQTCVKIPKASWILRIQDPGYYRMLDPIFFFSESSVSWISSRQCCRGILVILDLRQKRCHWIRLTLDPSWQITVGYTNLGSCTIIIHCILQILYTQWTFVCGFHISELIKPEQLLRISITYWFNHSVNKHISHIWQARPVGSFTYIL